MLTQFIAGVVTLVTLSIETADRPSSAAANPRENVLVSTEWLAKHLADPHLVLLHVGDPKEYPNEHIEGARLITLRDISRPHSPGALPLEMLPPQELRAVLEKLGISDDSRIVVYYGTDWVSPATRVVLTLDWIGLGDRTSLLDGGMQLWKREGRAVTGVVPDAAKRGRLSPRTPRADLIVDHTVVHRNLKTRGTAIIDARAAMFYDGPPHGEHRAGHVPGAANLPFNTVFGDDLRLLSADSLATLFRKAGVRPSDNIIVYCHIGQQATAVVFAARSLGYTARLYDASFDDWSARKELPVEGGQPGQQRGRQE